MYSYVPISPYGVLTVCTNPFVLILNSYVPLYILSVYLLLQYIFLCIHYMYIHSYVLILHTCVLNIFSFLCTTLYFLLLLSSYVLAILLCLFDFDFDNVKLRGKSKGRAVLHFIRNNKVIFVFTELVIQSVELN